jgi:hypothetical protein
MLASNKSRRLGWTDPYTAALKVSYRRRHWKYLPVPKEILFDNSTVNQTVINYINSSSLWYNGTSFGDLTHVQCLSYTGIGYEKHNVTKELVLMNATFSNCSCIYNGTFLGDWVDSFWFNVSHIYIMFHLAITYQL